MRWLFADERVVLAAEGGLFLVGWRDAPTGAQMDQMEASGRAWEAEHGPLALLNVAFSGTPTFSDDVRRKSSALTRDPSLFGLARAHVVAMEGLRGTAVRAFINTFLLLGRPPRPTKVFASTADAGPWLLPMLEAGDAQWTAARIEALVEELRNETLPPRGATRSPAGETGTQ